MATKEIVHRFHQALLQQFQKRPSRSNLTKSQRSLLQSIRSDPEVLIVNADKGLGPCAVKRSQYINDALKHLTDESTYLRLSREEAFAEAATTATLIRKWCDKHCSALPDSWITFVRNKLAETRNEPFGYFYLMYKIHNICNSKNTGCIYVSRMSAK